MDPSYLEWALKLSAANPNMSGAVFPRADAAMGSDYNYNLAFLNDPTGNLASNGHLSDIGKKPNHPTFSNESAYAVGNPGAGQWMPPLDESTGNWLYHNPSRGLFWADESQAYKQPAQQQGRSFFKALFQ